MKMKKALALGLASLTIAGVSSPVFASQDTNLATYNIEAHEATTNSQHTPWTGDDSWLNVRTPLLNWSNDFEGETSTTFRHYEPNVDLRYSISNTGKSTFTWKILDPSGEKWASGTLAPGKSKTYTAFWDLDDIPLGRYTLEIFVNDGSEGSAKASVRSL